MSKKITYKDISEKTGISVSTISRIVSGASVVSSEKNEKVLFAMKELGYIVPEKKLNEIDKNLSKLAILIHLPSISNPFYSEILKGIETIARQNYFQVLIREGKLNDSTYNQLHEILKLSHVKGMISMNHLSLDISKKIRSTMPLVQCSERNIHDNVPFVSIDNFLAAYKAVKLLILHGNKRIAIINGPTSYQYAKARMEGYKKALEEGNIAFDPNLVVELSDIDYELALSAGNQLFTKPNYPDAVFAVSDVIAAAVLKSVQQAGFQVPKDIEVIGFDNINISKIFIPSITTVSQPMYQLGLNSCEMLIKLIEHDCNYEPQSVLLNTEIIIRESTR